MRKRPSRQLFAKLPSVAPINHQTDITPPLPSLFRRCCRDVWERGSAEVVEQTRRDTPAGILVPAVIWALPESAKTSTLVVEVPAGYPGIFLAGSNSTSIRHMGLTKAVQTRPEPQPERGFAASFACSKKTRADHSITGARYLVHAIYTCFEIIESRGLGTAFSKIKTSTCTYVLLKRMRRT